MEWMTIQGLRIGVFPALRAMAPDLSVFVTTRSGGVSDPPFDSLNLGGQRGDRASAIRRNRRLLLAALGISPRRLARAGQIHGAEIAVIGRGGIYRGFDGFATAIPGLAVAVSTADCYPVVLYSPPERALAALHVGRAGARLGIIERAISVLRDRFGVEPAYAVAAIGPGICKRCYTVARNEAMRFPSAARSFRKGAWHLDLESFIVRSLRDAGLERGRILSSQLCTACNRELFYSHRRDRGVTGRQWTLACVNPPGEAGARCR